MAQSVKRPTSAQVMISRFMGSSPVSGPVLTARSLEPALDCVSPSLSAPPLLMLCLFPPLSKVNTHFFKKDFFKKIDRRFFSVSGLFSVSPFDFIKSLFSSMGNHSI